MLKYFKNILDKNLKIFKLLLKKDKKDGILIID